MMVIILDLTVEALQALIRVDGASRYVIKGRKWQSRFHHVMLVQVEETWQSSAAKPGPSPNLSKRPLIAAA